MFVETTWMQQLVVNDILESMISPSTWNVDKEQGEKRLAATKGSNDLIYNRLQFSMTSGPLQERFMPFAVPLYCRQCKVRWLLSREIYKGKIFLKNGTPLYHWCMRATDAPINNEKRRGFIIFVSRLCSSTTSPSINRFPETIKMIKMDIVLNRRRRQFTIRIKKLYNVSLL